MIRIARIAAPALLLALPATAQDAADTVAPEAAAETGAFEGLPDRVQAALEAKAAGQVVEASDWMVAAANPLAAEAGAKVLEAGGSAADAMIAVQLVLGLVEPQSSGLGGGAFLVWYDAASGELTTLDGRETAPLATTPLRFQVDGETMDFYDAVVGGLSVGTPGTPALLQAAHDRWGTQDWSSLFVEAIALAEDGFTVSPRLAGLVADDQDRLSRFQATADYFLPGGTPIAEGDTLTNTAYADTLRTLAENGAQAFYTGDIAQGIVDTVQNADGAPGDLALIDLEIYEVVERPAVCADFRQTQVCGMGPPSSGALTVGQILGMMDVFDPSPGALAFEGEAADLWGRIGNVSRLAFADRGRYMADIDFVPMPLDGLTDPAYLASRADLVAPEFLQDAAPGDPEWDHAMLWGDDDAIEFPSTSHISIVDAEGNALSMTTTIENGFGSRLLAPGGFLLNNELTDFSFSTHENGNPIANRVEPGKRPRSSMSPTIVMQDGAPSLVIGSPGGSRIIGYVAQAVMNVIDGGMDVQTAVATPHAVNRFGTFDLEEGTAATTLEAPLQALGFETNIRDLTSGLHAIAVGPDGLTGGADPRREGIAIGQ